VANVYSIQILMDSPLWETLAECDDWVYAKSLAAKYAICEMANARILRGGDVVFFEWYDRRNDPDYRHLEEDEYESDYDDDLEVRWEAEGF